MFESEFYSRHLDGLKKGAKILVIGPHHAHMDESAIWIANHRPDFHFTLLGINPKEMIPDEHGGGDVGAYAKKMRETGANATHHFGDIMKYEPKEKYDAILVRGSLHWIVNQYDEIDVIRKLLAMKQKAAPLLLVHSDATASLRYNHAMGIDFRKIWNLFNANGERIESDIKAYYEFPWGTVIR